MKKKIKISLGDIGMIIGIGAILFTVIMIMLVMLR